MIRWSPGGSICQLDANDSDGALFKSASVTSTAAVP